MKLPYIEPGTIFLILAVSDIIIFGILGLVMH